MKSYHSQEVFNFELLDPNLKLFLDLLIAEEVGSQLRPVDEIRHLIGHFSQSINFEKGEELGVGHVGLVQQLLVSVPPPSFR